MFGDVLDLRQSLPKLTSIAVDWHGIAVLPLFESVTSIGMVEVIVETYDSDIAIASEYDEARRALTTGHCGTITFVDKPFLKQPGIVHGKSLGDAH